MTQRSGTCWKCGRQLSNSDYGRQETCLDCGVNTRVCKNCVHYDTNLNNACRENQADRVVDKEASNFCDYFNPGTPQAAGGKTKSDLVSAAEALFKKKS